MPATFQLVIKSGPDEGKQIELEKPVQVIGRDQNADIPINDPEVSRKHARISNQGGQIIIEDLGSTNGTFVNNQRISAPYVLRPGELIFLGEHVTLLFEAIQSGDATVAVPGKFAGGPPPLQIPIAQPQQTVAVPFQAPQPITPQPVQNIPLNNYAPLAVQPYAGAIPGQPQASAPKKKLPKWAIILIIVVILLLVFCVLPLIIVDSMNLWCSGFLGNIMRAIGPGSCP
jgi:predicted component of type VI protein secretion system